MLGFISVWKSIVGLFSTHLQITITRNNGKGQWRVAGHVDNLSPLDCFEDGSDWKGPN